MQGRDGGKLSHDDEAGAANVLSHDRHPDPGPHPNADPIPNPNADPDPNANPNPNQVLLMFNLSIPDKIINKLISLADVDGDGRRDIGEI